MFSDQQHCGRPNSFSLRFAGGGGVGEFNPLLAEDDPSLVTENFGLGGRLQ